jgi:TatD DNase family protein
VIDSHAHLDACEEPVGRVLERAVRAGVTRVVTIGTGLDSCRRALELADVHDEVVAALGIDPHRAAEPDAGRVAELRPLLAHPRAVAVGETGLDNHHRFATPAQQLRLFEEHLALAEELSLPVVVHSRDAADETAAALAGFEGGAVVLHCFSTPALLDAAVDRGYYVSFAGNVTYPRAADLRAAAAVVPGERLLAETDSPYLAPQPVRGRPNEPAHVVHTVRALAEIRGVDAGELAGSLAANAAEAFGLPAPAPAAADAAQRSRA